MDIGTWLLTLFNSTEVGRDTAGNRYFIERRARGGGLRLRRWVIHPRAAAASPVPEAWQAWLRFPAGAAFADRRP